MKRYFKVIFTVCFFTLALFSSSFAQDISYDADPPPTGCDPIYNTRADGTICPIDDGLYFLLFVGLGYGIKKYRDASKVKAESPA